MKQRHILLLGLALVSNLIQADQATPTLLPEVAKLIDVKPINDPHMEQNAYVYSMAIDARDEDYFAVGKKIVEQTNKVVQLAIKEQSSIPFESDENTLIYRYKSIKFDITLEGKNYVYPCADIDDMHCVEKVSVDLPTSAVLFEKNKVLLARYQLLIEKPYYYSYSPLPINSPTPSFFPIMLSSSFRQIEAIKAIEQGEVEKGITILQQEQDFAKRLLASDAGVIDKAVAMRLLLTQYHTIASLLDHSKLQHHLTSESLIALLKPLSIKEQQALVSALESELAVELVVYETLNKEEAKVFLSGWFDEEAYAQVEFNYNKNQTMNEAFKKAQPRIEQAKITLPKAQKTYQALQDDHFETVCHSTDMPACLLKMKQRYRHNLMGGLLLEMPRPDYKPYFFRLYDLSNYLVLVNAKLLIKQQHISAEDVPAFLEHLGDKAKNPYSLEPFRWDAKKSTLSTRSLEAKQWNEFSLYMAMPEVEIKAP